MTPHPQRCETCQYYELRPEIDECMKCNHPSFKDDMNMHDILGVEFDRIEMMGCASHSSAPTEQSIRQDATEKVLDLIETFRKEQSKELKIHDMWIAEAEYLTELRKQEHP